MVRTFSAALAGLVLSALAVTCAKADSAAVVGYAPTYAPTYPVYVPYPGYPIFAQPPAHPYHVLYPAEVAPYVASGSVKRPLVLGRQGPRIAIAPARFHAIPYVSTFDRCFRRVRHGRHWHVVRRCA
jgi:hypothetical protein